MQLGYTTFDRLWESGGTLRTRQEKIFESTFIEYQQFVETYKRLPTVQQDGKTSRGTSLHSWRANIKSGNSGPAGSMDILNNYEEKVYPLLSKQLVEDERERAYDVLLKTYSPSPGDGWYPTTLKEYLDGDNRFKYFDIQFYTEVMKCLNEPTIDCLNEIRLVCDIFGNNNWSFIYYEIGMENITERVENVIENTDRITPRTKKVLRLRYGLDETRTPKSFREVGKEFSLTGTRIQQIQRKALRIFRHPSSCTKLLLKHDLTDEMMLNIMKNKIGHWFIIGIDEVWDENKIVVRLPIDKLDEALSLHGLEVDVGPCAYRIKSVTTRVEHELSLNITLRRRMGIKLTGTDRSIEYTEVQMTKEPPRPLDTLIYVEEMKRIGSIKGRENRKVWREKVKQLAHEQLEEFEKLIEDTKREELERKQRRVEELLKDTQEVHDSPLNEYSRLKANWTHEVKVMLEFIPRDGNWWMGINKLLEGYQIPTDLILMAQGVLLNEIEAWRGERVRNDYDFTINNANCILDGHNDYEFMYIIQLKRKR